MSSHVPAKPLVEVAKDSGSSYDFYPVPQGSWQESYDRDNKRYNIYLVLSVIFAVATFAFVSNLTIFHTIVILSLGVVHHNAI